MRWMIAALGIAAGGCEYCGGIGVLAGEYLSEENEKEQRLEECGECAAGERCNLLMSPGRCRPDPGVVGDPCGEWKSRPDHEFTCAEGLVCNQVVEPDTCLAPSVADGPCAHTGDCAPEFYCKEWKCRPTFARGAACTDSDECRPLVCHEALGSKCTDPTGADTPCLNNDDCQPGLFCTGENEDRKCRAP